MLVHAVVLIRIHGGCSRVNFDIECIVVFYVITVNQVMSFIRAIYFDVYFSVTLQALRIMTLCLQNKF